MTLHLEVVLCTVSSPLTYLPTTFVPADEPARRDGAEHPAPALGQALVQLQDAAGPRAQDRPLLRRREARQRQHLLLPRHQQDH